IAASNSNQEKEGPPQDSDIRQLIREECGIEVCEEQKQNMKDTILELVEICRQKELFSMHDIVNDLIESALNSKLLLINSQRLNKEKHKVKNVVEQPGERRTQVVKAEESSLTGLSDSLSLSEVTLHSRGIVKSLGTDLAHIVGTDLATLAGTDLEQASRNRSSSSSRNQSTSSRRNRSSSSSRNRSSSSSRNRSNSSRSKLLSINSINSQRLDKKEQEVKIVEEQPNERRNLAPILSTNEPENSLSMGYEHLSITPETESDEVTESNVENLLPIPSECKNFRVIHKNSTSLKNTSQISLVHAISPILSTKEPEHSFSMGYEHFSTTLVTELVEVAESSTKNFVPIPCECKVTSDNESESDKPIKDDSSAFTTSTNSIFNDSNDFTSNDNESIHDVTIKESKVFSNQIFDNDENNSDKLEREHAEYISRMEMLFTINGERKTRKGQNRNKAGQKREAWRSPEKSRPITVEKAGKRRKYKVKNKREKDKIGTNRDKNGKRGEARKRPPKPIPATNSKNGGIFEAINIKPCEQKKR
nr:hypothetical protein [Tanacetum cinerariifolium]